MTDPTCTANDLADALAEYDRLHSAFMASNTGDIDEIVSLTTPLPKARDAVVEAARPVAGLLPAALDIIAHLLAGWEPVEGEWVKFTGYSPDSPPNPNFERRPLMDAHRAVLDLVEDRQP
jgi:hypothetical protein